MRPISPLAWLPLGLIIFQRSEPAALFTIALCAMWPTVVNTAVGVRSISPEYLNVGRVLRLSRTDDAAQDHHPGDAALPLHRLPALARARVAGDRRLGDADRRARHRRLPLAGVQQPRLLPHPALDRHDRRDRLRARPPDGRRRGARPDSERDGVPRAPRRRTRRFATARGTTSRARRASISRSRRASSSRSSAPPAPARPRWCR